MLGVCLKCSCHLHEEFFRIFLGLWNKEWEQCVFAISVRVSATSNDYEVEESFTGMDKHSFLNQKPRGKHEIVVLNLIGPM